MTKLAYLHKICSCNSPISLPLNLVCFSSIYSYHHALLPYPSIIYLYNCGVYTFFLVLQKFSYVSLFILKSNIYNRKFQDFFLKKKKIEKMMWRFFRRYQTFGFYCYKNMYIFYCPVGLNFKSRKK